MHFEITTSQKEVNTLKNAHLQFFVASSNLDHSKSILECACKLFQSFLSELQENGLRNDFIQFMKGITLGYLIHYGEFRQFMNNGPQRRQSYVYSL
jgi:hypothetical protein